MSRKPWVIGIAAAGGFLIGVFALQIIASEGNFNMNAYTAVGFVILFLGGYIFTSNIFYELQSPVKGHFYLLLPARIEEKLIASWLMSSVFYLIISIVMLFLISFILSGVLALFFDGRIQLFQPFSDTALKIAGAYLVTQTIFLLGSVYFRKFNFLKTLLAIFVVYMIIFIWTIIMVFTIIRPQDLMVTGIENFNFQIGPENLTAIFNYIMGPFFLIVSYLRLKERQV